jgi:hypothetical protein
MRIHQWQLRGPDRTVKDILPETPPSVVDHGIIDDAMLYLTARRADDDALFRVFLPPDDLRRLVRRAMEQRRLRRSCVKSPADTACDSPAIAARWQNRERPHRRAD